jgi:MoxR-like ATPase
MSVVHTRSVATDSTILVDAQHARELVEAKRQDAGPGLVEARRAAEDEARAMLDGKAGAMTADEANDLLRLFNADAYRGEPRRWRFIPGFTGSLAQQLVRNLPRMNEALSRLWGGTLEEAMDELDTLMRRRDLPGAGRSLPSMLLYLRDRDRYTVLTTATAKGLRTLTGQDFDGANDRDGYVAFCEVATRVRHELGLAPQEVDWILAAASRPAGMRPSVADIREAWDRRAEWRRSEDWEEARTRALPALTDAVDRFLSGRDDVHTFRHAVDTHSKTQRHWGFKGGGQMFFNMIVKAAEPEHVSRALRAALPPPVDDEDCRRKFEEFSRFVNEAKESATRRGAAKPQFGYAPFFLSFFWEADAREQWPIYYPRSRQALSERGLWDESGSIADRYLRFRDVMAMLREELDTDQWGAESALYHLSAPTRGPGGPHGPPIPPDPPRSVYAAYLEDRLIFPDEVVTSVVLSLLAKPFLILTGISGTGKTKIATGLARYLDDGSSEPRHQLIAVRSDWTDPRGLIGYENPITERYATTPFLDLLLRAQADPESVYVAILDEMNLARVEYYFSDFLSALESGVSIPLRTAGDGAGDDGVPSSVAVGPNVLFVGTVNVDETTHAFSPKVLDRANVIEFSEVALDRYFERESESVPSSFRLRDAGVEPSAFLAGAGYEVDLADLPTSVTEALTEVHALLERDRLHFGYRVIKEIVRYVAFALALVDGDQDDVAQTAFDLQLLQKVLPKLTGGRELEPALGRLLAYCVDGSQPAGDDVDLALTRYRETAPLRYPRSAAKLARMLSRLANTGFVSALD